MRFLRRGRYALEIKAVSEIDVRRNEGRFKLHYGSSTVRWLSL
ncbi:MAG TPA: hypothetical protein VEJ67_03555 [Candidatus Cybelea sp.]|nr:hypothetical protein [Candidatus Cybelea sp.]